MAGQPLRRAGAERGGERVRRGDQRDQQQHGVRDPAGHHVQRDRPDRLAAAEPVPAQEPDVDREATGPAGQDVVRERRRDLHREQPEQRQPRPHRAELADRAGRPEQDGAGGGHPDPGGVGAGDAVRAGVEQRAVPDQQHDQRDRDADGEHGAGKVGPPPPRPPGPAVGAQTGSGVGGWAECGHAGSSHRIAASRGSASTTVDPLRLRSDCVLQSPMPRR